MVHDTIIYRPLSSGYRSRPAPVGDDEAQLNFILALVLGLVLVVVLFVVGVAVAHSRAKAEVAAGGVQPVSQPVARHAMCMVCEADTAPAGRLVTNLTD
ncbi:MAG: hypothetical protein KJ901_24470 [Gammaproteobacteria bacterium]|nr:hypothetical protein [Gammaproteobacteria bacterium]MBU1443819.1 hypothetical protein [Gammaproteobacteria bacterium]